MIPEPRTTPTLLLCGAPTTAGLAPRGGGLPSGAPRHPWLEAAAVFAALLVVPLVALVVTPAPAPHVLARATSQTLPRLAAAPSATHVVPTPPASARRETAAAPRNDGPICEGVCGVALDPDGRPAAGAQISCTRDESSFGATAGADGRWALAAEAAGCSALARKEGFVDSDPVRVAAGRDNTLRLAPPAAIEGVVVDASGVPVPSYWIGVATFTAANGAAQPPASGRPHKTEAPDGAFVMEGLAPGRYVLAVRADGLPAAHSGAIDVERGRRTRGVRIAVEHGATLTGTVTAARSGERLAGVSVSLDLGPALGPRPPPVTTDTAGAFSLPGVPASGPFSVRLAHTSYRQKIVTGLDARGAATLSVDTALTPRPDGGHDIEITGSGAMLATSPQGIVVAGVLEGGPAATAGLQKGDVIERIDGAGTAGLGLTECMQRLRGPEGSRVSVMVVRGGGRPLEIVITRDVIMQ